MVGEIAQCSIPLMAHHAEIVRKNPLPLTPWGI